MRRHSAFTLVELLVVIGIIAMLIGILLPTLGNARESARTIKCAANLHSIGLGMAIYLADNGSCYPAAYIYNGMAFNEAANIETPASPVSGYVCWSGLLYGNKSASTASSPFASTFGWDMFQCPSIDGGGLPPSNTFSANLLPGQTTETSAPGGLSNVPWNGCDLQSPRLAYVVNEAICPRNKFIVGFQSAIRTYHYVKAVQVRYPSDTILATEFNQSWRVVQPSGGATATISLSHRPVSGFIPLTSVTATNIDQMSPGTGYRRVVYGDLQKNAAIGATVQTTLDWVGRNHGSKRLDSHGYSMKTTNFLYVDGHVATKNVLQTLAPRFEWGAVFYSLTPNSDLQP